MTSEHQVLIDSDFWCGLFLPNDPHYQTSYGLFEQFARDNVGILTTTAVIGETATVISHKVGQTPARDFLTRIADLNLPVVHISKALHEDAMKVFAAQKKKGTSYVDCTNVAVVRYLQIPTVCSYDTVYHKKFGLKNLAYPASKAA